MFRYFRRLSETLAGIHAALTTVCAVLRQDLEARGGSGALEERVQRLEVEQERWQARMEGELMRAEQKFKAARASEERERHARKAVESDEEGDEDELEQWRRLIQEGHAAGGDGGTVPAVSGDMDRYSEKERLRRQKFGL